MKWVQKKKRKTGKTWPSTPTMWSSHANQETEAQSHATVTVTAKVLWTLSRKTLGGSVIVHWHWYKAVHKLWANLRPASISQCLLTTTSAAATDGFFRCLHRAASSCVDMHVHVSCFHRYKIWRNIDVIHFSLHAGTAPMIFFFHYNTVCYWDVCCREVIFKNFNKSEWHRQSAKKNRCVKNN